MRKFIVLAAGLLLGGAMLTSTGTPAKADIGCLCGKLGANAACVATVIQCNFSMGGVCVAPCAYEPGGHKMGRRHHHHHKKKSS